MTSLADVGTPAKPCPANALRLRFRGPVNRLSTADVSALFSRHEGRESAEVRERTADIIARVRLEGDAALVALAREYDQVTLDRLEVSRETIARALAELDPNVRCALERAAENIARVHRAFRPQPSETSPEPGIVIGRRPAPLARVGVYAPGGRAAYPSSVLMGAIPARIAGVGEIVLCSPPRDNGLPSPALLAAAALAGVDRVFPFGGAGAIAAMALGTETVPRVDRIVGPGNAYVAEAKLQLTNVVAIDAPAGPSELLVIADATSDPEIVARELLAQAEHDPLACVVAIAIGEHVAPLIECALARQIVSAPRQSIIEQALAGQGAVLWVDTVTEAVAVANRYAPEHLLLALPSIDRCEEISRDVRGAGTVFVGESASNAFGDYMTGANHVLPTGGLARSYSGLSTLDFVRWTTYQRIDRSAAARIAPAVAAFAEAEGLPGHATAARAWSTGAVDSAASTTIDAVSLVRRDVAMLSTYSEARDDAHASNATIDLSDNTNLWGTPPAAEAALRDVGGDAARYPSPYSAELKQALAEYVGVIPGNIVTGCGSDDILDAAMRAFASTDEAIAYSTPTFSMIPTFARLNGLRAIEIPLGDADRSYDIDAEQLVETGAKIIYICSPNNPTATTVSRAALQYVVEHAAGLVILDETYAEFAGCTGVDLTTQSDRLLVTRTFSKAFGLAGLRVGYGVGNSSLVNFVERTRGPYKVTAPAVRAARAVLRDDPMALGWMRDRARLTCENRERFLIELRQLGFAPMPSAANFVLLPHAEAPLLARRLRDGGLLVRPVTDLPRSIRAFAASAGHAIRITVGPWDVMLRALDLLAGALS